MTRFPIVAWSSLGVLVFGMCGTMAAADPVIAEIEKLGGTVRETAINSGEFTINFGLGGSELTDAGLAQVAKIKNIVSLNLAGTKISDTGLAHLAGLTTLRRLHLENTSVGDDGIAHLQGLTNLEYLNLYGTKATDKALAHLKNHKKLRRLFLWQTDVTDAGVANLAKSLPELSIVRGADISYRANIVEPKRKPPQPLKWLAASDNIPKSRTGSSIVVYFENHSGQHVKVVWIGYDGKHRQYAELAPGAKHEQNTYSDQSWLITDANDQPLGYFRTTEDEGLAIIPKP